MIEFTKRRGFVLVAVVAANVAVLAGCGKSDDSTPEVGAALPAASAEPMPAAASEPATVEDVSRERVLRAMKCQIVLSQSIGVAMANGDTGLPPELASRLKASTAARWQKFAEAHAQASGVQDSDRAEIVVQLNTLSSTDSDRETNVDIVRDCLDNEP